MKVLSLLLLSVMTIGCSGGDAPSLQSKSAESTTATAAVEDEAIRAASERFLTSILRGDASEAMRWLTPRAAERAASDPTVLATLDFQVSSLEVGEVRRLSAEEAAAQCLLSEAGSDSSEEVCCLLKRSKAGWRVCGLACDAGPNSAPAMINFEPTPEATGNPAQGNSQFVTDPTGIRTGVSPSRTAAGSSPTDRR